MPKLTPKKRGRPRKFTDPAEFERKIEEYFESCWVDKITEHTDKDGAVTMSTVRYQNRPYTVAGLALALNMTRETLCQYVKDGEFSDIVKKAKQKIEMFVEEILLEGKNAAGPIFWLKNHASYTDKHIQEITGKDGEKLDLTVNFVKPADK